MKAELARLSEDLGKRLAPPAGFAIQSMGGPLGNNYFFDGNPVSDGSRHTVVASSPGTEWSFESDGQTARRIDSLAGSNSGHWFGDLTNPTNISLGQHTNGTGNPRQSGHQGAFGDILIYDHALTSAERSQLHLWIRHKYETAGPGPRKPPSKGLRLWFDASDVDADSTTPNPELGRHIPRWSDRASGLSLEQSTKALQPRLTTLGSRKAAAVLFDKSFLKGTLANLSLIHIYETTRRNPK